MVALSYSFDALMSEAPFEEPLIAGGVRCHGGYIGGEYVSPRSAVRGPAIVAWRDALRAGLPLITCPHGMYRRTIQSRAGGFCCRKRS
jgi:hypothetical protein